jgi:hypothetical protein
MSFLTDFQIAFQKKEAVTLLSIVILVYLLVMHTSFSYNNILFMIPAFALGYLYYIHIVDKSFASMHTQNEKLGKIDIDGYPYIQEDIETIDILLQIEPLFFINRLQYIEVFQRLNHFFQLYRELKSNVGTGEQGMRPADKYRLAKDECNMMFNALGTFVVRLDTNDERTKLNDTVRRLKTRCQLYLNEMESYIQKDWNDGNVTIYSQPVYPDDPDPSVFGDVQYSQHYNLY